MADGSLFDWLRPHQRLAVSDAVSALRVADRAQVVMACGTGKTRVGVAIHEARKPAASVVLLPSLSLISQTLKTWRERTPDLRYLVVCSDKSVDDEVRDGIVSVTQDPAEVAAFLKRPGVILSTYHSAPLLAGLAFDFGLFDEAHKTVGAADKLFAFALDDANVRIAKRLFMTATPKNIRGGGGMDDEAVYGRVAHRLPFSRAVEAGLICGYTVLLLGVHGRELKGEPANPESIGAVALRKAIKVKGVKKAITFHSDRKSARAFSEMPLNAETFYFDGSQSAGVREKKKAAFAAAPLGVATNARCLTEGVDVPAVDLVGFLTPKTSTVDIVQAAGRAMRVSPGKETGYILVPVFVEDDERESVADILKKTRYSYVWDILSSLQDHDDALARRVSSAYSAFVRQEKNEEPRATDGIEVVDLDITDEQLELVALPRMSPGGAYPIDWDAIPGFRDLSVSNAEVGRRAGAEAQSAREARRARGVLTSPKKDHREIAWETVHGFSDRSVTHRELAARIGAHPGSVAAARRRHGLTRPQHTVDWHSVSGFLDTSISTAEIARRAGVSHSAALRARSAVGVIDPRPRTDWSSIDGFSDPSVSSATIAARAGTTAAAASAARRKSGVKAHSAERYEWAAIDGFFDPSITDKEIARLAGSSVQGAGTARRLAGVRRRVRGEVTGADVERLLGAVYRDADSAERGIFNAMKKDAEGAE